MTTEEITIYMKELRKKWLKEGEIGDRDIAILSQMFMKRDYPIPEDKSFPSIEGIHCMRGFTWGAMVFRQIVEGHGLDKDE
jgi:hypothetical protein